MKASPWQSLAVVAAGMAPCCVQDAGVLGHRPKTKLQRLDNRIIILYVGFGARGSRCRGCYPCPNANTRQRRRHTINQPVISTPFKAASGPPSSFQEPSHDR